MLRVYLSPSNCDVDKPFVIEEIANASVTLELHFDEIVSAQTRAERRQELTEAIQRELSRFRWLISGSVQVEFAWYLHGVQRQETDKIGDIDNITKPILDALVGPHGILIDDSQIGSLHTFWMSRNEQLTYSVLKLKVSFCNDECLDKAGLVFIQYRAAMCVAINIDFADPKSVFGVMTVVRARKRYRALAQLLEDRGANADRFLVNSTWDFHRTRVGAFARESIITMEQLRQRAVEGGVTWRALLALRRPMGRLPRLLREGNLGAKQLGGGGE